MFALGDVSTLTPRMAGRARRQAQLVADNIRALIDGGLLQKHEPTPEAILVTFGPDGGSANSLRTSLRLWGLLWSVRLLSRADQDLVDAYPLRLADGVGYGVRYVLGLERLYVPLLQPLADFLVGDVVG